MLEEIKIIAQKLFEIDIENVEITMKEEKIIAIKNQICSHLGIYGMTPPDIYNNPDLKMDIMGVKFHFKEKKSEYIGKFKLSNPSMLVDTGNELRELNKRIQKSYWEREQQIFDASSRGKEDLIEWISKNKSKMSFRLHNAMIKAKGLYGLTLDELTWKEFYKYRGCGKIGWNEFVKLRGY